MLSLTMFELKVYMFIGIFLFVSGLLGLCINRSNIMILLMCLELMLLGINFNLIIISAVLDDLTGQVFALFVLTVAAAEAAIGLAILIVYYRLKGIISIDYINNIKG